VSDHPATNQAVEIARVDVGGFYRFRIFRTLLDETGAPMKVQQELKRHAHIHTTINVYGKAMRCSKREAQGCAHGAACEGGFVPLKFCAICVKKVAGADGAFCYFLNF